MEDKLKKLNIVKSISLTEEERGLLHSKLTQETMLNVCVPATSLSTYFYRGIQHGLRMSLSALFFVVFVGGSVSAIADSALPGDPLYNFKINVNEEIKGVFLSSPEEKVAWQKKRVENRAAEIRTLSDSKTLTKAKQEKAHQALTNQVEKLSKELTVLSDTTPSAALNVTASIEESLRTTKETLEHNSPKTKESEDVNVEEASLTTMNARISPSETALAAALRTVDDALNKVSKEEVKIITKEIDNIAKEIETKSIQIPQEITPSGQ